MMPNTIYIRGIIRLNSPEWLGRLDKILLRYRRLPKRLRILVNLLASVNEVESRGIIISLISVSWHDHALTVYT